MNEQTQQFILPIILGMIACQGLWELVLYKIKKKDCDKDNLSKVFDELEKINNRLKDIENEMKEVKNELKSNTLATNGNLYAELDKLLDKMDLIGCWSSEGRAKWEDLIALYKKIGNGKSQSLEDRANAIPVDNTKFHERLSRYNKHKISVMCGEDR